MSLPEHILKNREVWTRNSVSERQTGRKPWSQTEINWGIWGVPEASVQALAGIDLAGRKVVELGCGTGYFSAWLARLGAKPTGIDITPGQLTNARAFQQEFGIEFPLIEANAEDTGLPGESFDLAISEYGASIWCDPEKWIPEASRLLKPGGTLIFLRNGTQSMLCMPTSGPVTTQLQRPYRALRRIEWEDDQSVEFQCPPSDMIRILRASGFEIEALIDLYPPEDAPETNYEFLNLDWSRQWPSEEIWRARKKIPPSSSR